MTDLSLIQSNIEFSYLQDQTFNEFIIGDRRIFRCSVPLCGKTFKFKSEMNRHLASHSSLRPFPCLHPSCGKTFKRQDALNNHIRLHEQATPYICPEEDCGSEFTTRSALRYHILKHTGEKFFQCDQPGCDRTFMTLAQLKQHMKASTYHKKLRTLSSTSDSNSSLMSYYSPRGETVLELPVIKYEFTSDLDKVEKRLKDTNEDIRFRSKELENEQFDSFDYLRNIYGKTSNEFSHINLYDGFINKIPELNIKENPPKIEVNTKLYSALKSIIDDNVPAYKDAQIESKIVEPIQNPIKTVNTVDNSLIVSKNVGLLEPTREKSLDFDSWLQREGLHNLYY